DGYSALTFPVNCTSSPIELLELTSPLRVLRKELLPDSAGDGRFRGGLGQRLTYDNAGDVAVSASLVADKIDSDPLGFAGGGPGRRGAAYLGTGERVASKGRLLLAPGDTLHLELPGGGGFGEPSQRPTDAVERDIALGHVTEEH